MKLKAIYYLLIYHSVMRWLTDYLDSDSLNYIMGAVLISGVAWFVYSYSDKTVVSKMSLGLIVLLSVNQIINVFYELYMHVSLHYYLPYFTAGVTILEIYKNKSRIINWFKE